MTDSPPPHFRPKGIRQSSHIPFEPETATEGDWSQMPFDEFTDDSGLGFNPYRDTIPSDLGWSTYFITAKALFTWLALVVLVFVIQRPAFTSLMWTLPVLALVAGLWCMTWMRSVRVGVIVLVLFLFLGLVTPLLADVLNFRMLSTLLLSFVAFFVFAGFLRPVFYFWTEWIYTRPLAVIPAQRPLLSPPNPVLLGVILFGLIVGPHYSPFYALLGLVTFCTLYLFATQALIFMRSPLPEHRRPTHALLLFEAKQILYHYVSYGADFDLYPGMFRPSENPESRIRRIKNSCIVLAALIATAFCGPLPWDFPVFKERFLRTFSQEVWPDASALATFQFLTPGVDWNSFPPPPSKSARPPDPRKVVAARGVLSDQQYEALTRRFKTQTDNFAYQHEDSRRVLAQALNDTPFASLYLAYVSMKTEKDKTLAWAFALPIPLLFFLYYLVLYTLFYKPLRQAYELRIEVDSDGGW